MAQTIIEPIESFGLSKKDREKKLFSKIGVVGCGRDGQAIVGLCASVGIEVVFIEISQDKIDNAINRISENLDSKVENWGLTTSEKKGIMNRIFGSLNYNDLRDCDFVIECIRYDDETGQRSTAMRKEIFKQLEQVLAKDAIIATNATTVVISELAADLTYRERCVSILLPITHPDARIMEVVKGIYTSPEVIEKVMLFGKLIKYQTVEVYESNGLVSLRILVTMLNEACQMVMEGISNIEEIDKMFEIGYGMRLGVFRMADIYGIEKIVALMEEMFNEHGDRKYKPSPLIWRLFRAKQFGVRKGIGFYIYEGTEPVEVNQLGK